MNLESFLVLLNLKLRNSNCDFYKEAPFIRRVDLLKNNKLRSRKNWSDEPMTNLLKYANRMTNTY